MKFHLLSKLLQSLPGEIELKNTLSKLLRSRIYVSSLQYKAKDVLKCAKYSRSGRKTF